jgi:hypothetical protein
LAGADCFWEFPFADACVLVRPELPNVYILNPTAASAWRLFRAKKPIDEAAEEFAFAYNIPRETATRDLLHTWAGWEGTLLAPLPSARITSPIHSLPDGPANCFSCDYRLREKNIRVVLTHPDLVAEIAPRIEPLLAASSCPPDATLQITASEDGYHLFSGTTCIATEEDPASVRVFFLQEFARIAEASEEWMAILHAAACGIQDKCVIFPAASHSGKTTLAAGLMKAGLTFYADDSVALQASSLKIPAMPFAMMIREGSWPVISARFPDFQKAPIHERYGENVRFFYPPEPAHKFARPSAIVFSQWRESGGTTIEELDPFSGLLRLRNSGFWVTHDRNSISSFLDWLLSLPIYQMSYSDLDEAAKLATELLVSRLDE